MTMPLDEPAATRPHRRRRASSSSASSSTTVAGAPRAATHRRRRSASPAPAATVAAAPSGRSASSRRCASAERRRAACGRRSRRAVPDDTPKTATSWPPMDVIEHDRRADVVPPPDARGRAGDGIARSAETDGGGVRKPDPEIECIVTLQPAKPVGVGALAAGLHARLGKRLRWFGRTAPDAPWQPLASDTRGEFVEVAACLLLADRNGAASRAQLDTFARVIGRAGAAAAGRDVGARRRRRGRARRSARPPVRGRRRADRPDRPHERQRQHPGHQAARHRRGGRLPAGVRRPLRVGAGGHRRGPRTRCRTCATSRSRWTRCACRRPTASCSCSTCRAWPIRRARSTR